MKKMDDYDDKNEFISHKNVLIFYKTLTAE